MNPSQPHVIHLLVMGLPPLTVLISIPMILGWIKPNRWYGVRTRKTLSSPEIWYRANRVGGIYLTIATLAALVAWWALAFCPMPEALRPAIDLAVLGACVMLASVAILGKVQKM